MSWDVFVQDFPANTKSVGDIPADFDPAPVGSRRDIIRCIKGMLPEADFSDPSWGTIETPECSMEIDLGDNDQVMAFAFHVHGGEHAPNVILKILERLNLRAVDNGTGQFLDEVTAAIGFEAWREYRDQALASDAN